MKILYIDCTAGVSGSALLGALVNAGIDQKVFLNEINETIKADFHLSFKKALIKDVFATRVVLEVPAGEQAVPVVEFIEKEMDKSKVQGIVADALYKIFTRYAAARSKLHDIPLEKITTGQSQLFRMYIIAMGFCIAMNRLGAEKVVSTPVPVYGTICDSAEPASDPLILELARGIKVRRATGRNSGNSALGMALLAAGAGEFGELPEMFIHEIGYGALENIDKTGAVVRVVSGADKEMKRAVCGEEETILVIETSIDDMNPEFFPYLIEGLLALGAVDAFLTPIYMKKGRPANLLTVLCRKEKLENVLQMIFKEATTLGVRIREENRRVLGRKFFKVSTPYGEVSIKAGYLGQREEPVQMAPEFEDCKRIAMTQNIPLKEVYAAAQRAAFEKNK